MKPQKKQEQEDILKRLNECIDELMKDNPALTNVKMSEAFLFTPNYISDRRGGTKPVTDKLLDKLQAKYLVSKEYIKTGRGPKFVTQIKFKSTEEAESHFLEHYASCELSIPVAFLLREFGAQHARLVDAEPEEIIRRLYEKVLLSVSVQPKGRQKEKP